MNIDDFLNSPPTSTDQYKVQNIVIPSQSLQVPIWSKNETNFEGVFTENIVRVTDNIKSMIEITSTSIFLKLFPESLLEHISFHTNLCVTQEGKPYVPTIPNEIKIFFAMNMFISLKKLPSYRDY